MPAKKTSQAYYRSAQAALIKRVSRQAINLAIQRKILTAKAKRVTRTQWLISAEDLAPYPPYGRQQESGNNNNSCLQCKRLWAYNGSIIMCKGVRYVKS